MEWRNCKRQAYGHASERSVLRRSDDAAEWIRVVKEPRDFRCATRVIGGDVQRRTARELARPLVARTENDGGHHWHSPSGSQRAPFRGQRLDDTGRVSPRAFPIHWWRQLSGLTLGDSSEVACRLACPSSQEVQTARLVRVRLRSRREDGLVRGRAGGDYANSARHRCSD